MPYNANPRMWKVTFRNLVTGEEDSVYPTAVNRNDAVLIGKESTKLRPEECLVTATTNFDHFNTVKAEKSAEYGKEKGQVESVEEVFTEGPGPIDKDKLPISQEEAKEEKLLELSWPPHSAIVDAIVAYFVRITAPRMTATELLNVFEDCPASIKDLKKFLDDHNLNW